jgi:hypothetical protein
MAFPTVQNRPVLNQSMARDGARIGAGASNRREREKVGPAPAQIADPLFILSAPRSFSSVVCAMLGQHPQMHGLPETHLFAEEMMDRWLGRSSRENYPMAHGLLRAVAHLFYGGQTEDSVKRAGGWLVRRASSTSGMVFEELALQVSPAILVDKSPSMVYSLDSMRRAHQFFPQARFIHLVRHPRGQGYSVLKYRNALARPEYQSRERQLEAGTVPDWLSNLASFPYSPRGSAAYSELSDTDPQRGWYVLNRNIVDFLQSVPGHQWVTIRGEELLTEPDEGLATIAEWLGVRDDREAIELMKHPESSPYACFGPPQARCGNDIFFLQDPVLHKGRAEPQSLEGALAWRRDGRGFLPEVKELAQRLGYR